VVFTLLNEVGGIAEGNLIDGICKRMNVRSLRSLAFSFFRLASSKLGKATK
jgi:hypothetical protein